MKNTTDQDKIVAYNFENFTAETNEGHKFSISEFGAGGYVCTKEEKLLKPGETLDLCAALPMLISVDLTIPNIEYIGVSASNISRIQNAKWKVSANFR